MDAVVGDLAAQQAELTGLLDGLADTGWHAPTRCDGWDVADVVLHLAQTNELALGSITGRFATVAAALSEGLAPATSIDDGAALMVARQRGQPNDELCRRWSAGASRLVAAFDAMDLSRRVPWVAGELSARSLATTRLAETWIHTGDVADALAVTLPATGRLWQIARLAWRTLPYAFESAGRTMAGPVAFRLVAPDGEVWEFGVEDGADTVITGPAVELCAVAARRADPSETTLSAQGPDADGVLALIRTYAL
jgi:uncharacterized protein (TIGR03084 family)